MLCYLTELNKQEDPAEEALLSLGYSVQTARGRLNISQGKTAAESIWISGISDVTCYRWRKAYGYGGMSTLQVKRLKEVEKENQQLHKAVSDLTLDKLILQEAA